MNKKELNYYTNFGYKYFGPLLLNFSRWLLDDLQKKNIKKVYFLARDGYIMKKAFDVINNQKIKSYYLYASRRSIIVPYLWKLEKPEKLFDTIAFNKNIKVKSFLKKIGLDDINCDVILNKFNLTMDDIINTENKENLLPFLEELFPIIQKNSKKEWESMKLYFKKNEFYGKVAIIDIGWYGTMQNSLEKIFENNDIYGYYFGLVPNSKIVNKKCKGYIFSQKNNNELYNKMRYFINVFEFLFLAQHGSVKKYIDNKSVELYEYEYENYKERKIALNIQNSAIRYVEENKNIKYNPKLSTEKFINFFLYPSFQTSKKFGDLQFNDDEFKYIAKPKSIFTYIIHPKKFKEDFISSSWRIGFLKRLFIIPLPYFKINNKIRKIFINERTNK